MCVLTDDENKAGLCPPVNEETEYLICCDASLSPTPPTKKRTVASIGIAVLDDAGALVASRAILVPNWTPNTTALEYKALYCGLETATELGIKRLVLANDNEQAVLKMSRYLAGPICNLPPDMKPHIERLTNVSVRRTVDGEEKLPHNLARRAIAEYRVKKPLSANRPASKRAERAATRMECLLMLTNLKLEPAQANLLRVFIDTCMSLSAKDRKQLARERKKAASAEAEIDLHAEEQRVWGTAITFQQGADFLHVSRPCFVRLLDEGKIPCQKVGARRRVHREDVLRYMDEYSAAADKALHEMAAENLQLDLYP